MALGRSNINKGKKGRAKPDRFVAVIGGASALAFVVLLGFFLHILSKPSQARVAPGSAPVERVNAEILVPVETIKVGSSFQPTMFRKEIRREEQVTGDMIRSFDELKGQYAKGVLIKGQPVLKGALTNRQPVHVLTALLPKGYRAVALQVEKPLLDNVDGWAQPGTDVDVVWITDVFGKEIATVLAGPVRVLASNKATEWSQKKGGAQDKLVTVTLLLPTKDAVRISLAALHGKISLSLRGLSDKRPNEGSRPISVVVDEPIAPRAIKPVLSVKVHDPGNNTAELRQYDTTGRRIGASEERR